MPSEEQQVRVLLVGLPAVLSEIVRQVVRDAQDIEIVGEIASENDVLQAIEDGHVELLLCAEGPERAWERWAELLRRRPSPTILNLAEDGRRAQLHQLWPETLELGELSADALVSAIRLRSRSRVEVATR